MLTSKFDNLCPKFAKRTTNPKCQTMECLHSNWMTYELSEEKVKRFTKSLEYVYYSLLLLFTQKKRLIELKDLNNGEFT